MQKKTNNNAGEEYVSVSNKQIIPARKNGPACRCNKECFTSLNDKIHKKYFLTFESIQYKIRYHSLNSLKIL